MEEARLYNVGSVRGGSRILLRGAHSLQCAEMRSIEPSRGVWGHAPPGNF